MKEVKKQNDRQISVFIDRKGNHGKSWLAIHLWERGLACIVPRAYGNARSISAFICSVYSGQRYIVVDIARSGKYDKELYQALEEIKDGLVFDERYTGKCRNIRGVKLIVFTNSDLDYAVLSRDRWLIWEITDFGLYDQTPKR